MKTPKKLVECPICGQKMRYITNTHVMKKHGMTIEEFNAKYGALASRVDISSSESMKSISDAVVHSIITNEQITSIAQEVIHSLVKDHEAKLRITLNLFATRRIKSLSDMYDKIEEIRNSLMDSTRIAGMSDVTQIKLLQTLERSFNDQLEYIKSMSTDRDKKIGALFDQSKTVINIFENDETAPKVPESPRSREKIRGFLEAVLESVNSSDKAIPVEVKELPNNDEKTR